MFSLMITITGKKTNLLGTGRILNVVIAILAQWADAISRARFLSKRLARWVTAGCVVVPRGHATSVVVLRRPAPARLLLERLCRRVGRSGVLVGTF